MSPFAPASSSCRKGNVCNEMDKNGLLPLAHSELTVVNTIPIGPDECHQLRTVYLIQAQTGWEEFEQDPRRWFIGHHPFGPFQCSILMPFNIDLNQAAEVQREKRVYSRGWRFPVAHLNKQDLLRRQLVCPIMIQRCDGNLHKQKEKRGISNLHGRNNQRSSKNSDVSPSLIHRSWR